MKCEGFDIYIFTCHLLIYCVNDLAELCLNNFGGMDYGGDVGGVYFIHIGKDLVSLTFWGDVGIRKRDFKICSIGERIPQRGVGLN